MHYSTIIEEIAVRLPFLWLKPHTVFMAMASPQPPQLAAMVAPSNTNKEEEFMVESASSKGWEKGVKEANDRGLASCYNIPRCYMQRIQDRPSVYQADYERTTSVPVIDFQAYSQADCASRMQLVLDIGLACQEWGCFQLINHGVPESVIQRIWTAARTFFHQPVEERMRFHTTDFQRAVSYAISAPKSEKEGQAIAGLPWKDSLTFHYVPGEIDGFQEGPDYTREACVEYVERTQALVELVLGCLSEFVGLKTEGLLEGQGGKVNLRCLQMHYYPKCPRPDVALGARSHSDIVTMTVLLQDQVGGFQVLDNHNSWVAVKPVPNALLINVGDQLEIMTNGQYKSVEHRVVTNGIRSRMSIASFFAPCKSALIGPLLPRDGINAGLNGKPLIYRGVPFEDYVKNYFRQGATGRSNLDFARLLPTSP